MAGNQKREGSDGTPPGFECRPRAKEACVFNEVGDPGRMLGTPHLYSKSDTTGVCLSLTDDAKTYPRIGGPAPAINLAECVCLLVFSFFFSFLPFGVVVVVFVFFLFVVVGLLFFSV